MDQNSTPILTVTEEPSIGIPLLNVNWDHLMALPSDRDILIAIFNKLESLDSKIDHIADTVNRSLVVQRQGLWTRFRFWLKKIFT